MDLPESSMIAEALAALIEKNCYSSVDEPRTWEFVGATTDEVPEGRAGLTVALQNKDGVAALVAVEVHAVRLIESTVTR